MKVEEHPYGTLPDGRTVAGFTLENANRISIELISYGAILTSVRTPDREGHVEQITLGFDSLDGYLANSPYFGATIGRFANRIADGRFELDGKPYLLACNNGRNHLHGGIRGFDKRLWKAVSFSRGSVAGVRFTYLSTDGEEGYPGNLNVAVTYTLAENDSLEIRYTATTDRPTPINLTNHAYWNLKGAGTINDHLLTLYANAYLPVDDTLIPTGEIRPVDSTPFDFRREKPLGQDIETVGGYDHCYVVSTDQPDRSPATNNRPLRPIARVFQPVSGRGLRVSGTQPGVQLYTGNSLSNVSGRRGKTFGPHSAFCLETQAFPDAVNQQTFPSAILRPTERYDEVAKFDFYRN